MMQRVSLGNRLYVCVITITVGLTLMLNLIENHICWTGEKKRDATYLLDDLVFSKDGSRLFCSRSDGTIRTIDPRSGEQSSVGRPFSVLWTFAISRESAKVAIGDGRDLKVLDLKTFSDICSLSGHTGSIVSIVFPNEDTLISGSTDGSVRIWDVKRKEMKRKLIDQAYEILKIACTGDTEFLVAGDAQGNVMIWKQPFDKMLYRFPAHRGTVQSLAFSVDGTKLITIGGDNTVKIWDFSTRKEEFTLRGHGGPVISLAVSTDGKHLATGSSRDNVIFVWNIKTGAEVAKFVLPNHPKCLAFSPDAKMLVAGSGKVPSFSTGVTSGSNPRNSS